MSIDILLAEVPELSAVGVLFAWDMPSQEGFPLGLCKHRHGSLSENPAVLLQLMQQTAKLQRTLSDSWREALVRGDAIAQELAKTIKAYEERIQSKASQLRQLEEACQAAQAKAAQAGGDQQP